VLTIGASAKALLTRGGLRRYQPAIAETILNVGLSCHLNRRSVDRQAIFTPLMAGLLRTSANLLSESLKLHFEEFIAIEEI